MNVFDMNTRLGAYLSTENYFRMGGIVGSMTLEFLDCYVDASGKDTNASDTVLSVNGCLSTPLKWQEFDRDWNALLKSEKFSPDPTTGKFVFHAAKFWSGNCPLMPSNLSRADKQRIHRGLIEVIRKHTVYRFG
ncbi:MAG: hypothetical protein H0U23_13590, partial [Blastocatellia bacterium]|nr:hypothetical protein [Blastocatellia bacterium]